MKRILAFVAAVIALAFAISNAFAQGIVVGPDGKFITRTRLLGRFQFGEGVRGWSLGLAVSF